MEENLNAGNTVETAPQTNVGEEKVGTTPTNTKDVESTSSNAKAETFTQDDVNRIVKERLAREDDKFYKNHNVKDEEELSKLLDKANRYDALDNDFNSMKSENFNLKEQNAFITNDIDPNRYDDIRAYFKGKELDFSNDALKQELETHPEWKVKHQVSSNETTITALGVDNSSKQPQSEDDKIKELFGV